MQSNLLKLIIAFFILLATGCQTPEAMPEIVKETIILNNSQVCIPQICECKVEPIYINGTQCSCDCDEASRLKLENKKLSLNNGKCVSELAYWKNITSQYFMNDTAEVLQENLTDCQEENQRLKDILSDINQTLG